MSPLYIKMLIAVVFAVIAWFSQAVFHLPPDSPIEQAMEEAVEEELTDGAKERKDAKP
jgi:hypothetical protein